MKDKKMIVDFHTHTFFSDGIYSPTKVVQKAIENGLDIIAISDHDTVDGIKEIKNSISVIPAIEITTRGESFPFGKACLHILGYGIQLDTIYPFMQKLSVKQNNVIDSFLYDSTKMGITLSPRDINPAHGTMIQFSDLVTAFMNSIPKYNSEPERFLNHYSLLWNNCFYSTREVIDIIHASGGIAVWAHPFISYFNSAFQSLTTEFISTAFPKLISYGLDGIEAYYMTFSDHQKNFLINLAKKYSLMISGGSDFHGYEGRDSFASIESNHIIELFTALGIESK